MAYEHEIMSLLWVDRGTAEQVEDWMRLEQGTLDGLTAVEFEHAACRAQRSLQTNGPVYAARQGQPDLHSACKRRAR